MPLSQRQRALKYTYEPFYVTMAMNRGLTREQVLRRAVRRAKAAHKLGAIKDHHIYRNQGLDNPFIESHAWKYLMRQAIADVRPWQKQQKS